MIARLLSNFGRQLFGERLLCAANSGRPDKDAIELGSSRERTELFSPFSSFDHDGQCCSFLIQRDRDKLSTRKFDVGVFTQPEPKGDLNRRIFS